MYNQQPYVIQPDYIRPPSEIYEYDSNLAGTLFYQAKVRLYTAKFLTGVITSENSTDGNSAIVPNGGVEFWETLVQLYFDIIKFSVQEVCRLNRMNIMFLGAQLPCSLFQLVRHAGIETIGAPQLEHDLRSLEFFVSQVRNPGYYKDGYSVPTPEQQSEFKRIAEWMYMVCFAKIKEVERQ